jgi:O-antigen/teichoic acid export membrane protein
MLSFGLPLVISNLGLFVLNFSDRFFLQHLRSLDVVGVYAVGYKFGYMMNYLVVQPFFIMWQTRMYAIHAQPQHPKIFRQVFIFYSLGLIYFGLAMSMFSHEVVGAMVEAKFAASAQVIPLVVLAYIFYGLSYYAQLGMFLTDRTNRIGVIGAVTAGLNLVLNYFLILRYGMMGAAWATVLSFAAIAVISYVCSQRVYRLPLNVGRTLAGMVLAAGLFECSSWLNSQRIGIAAAVMVKIGMLAVFPLAVWKFGIMPSTEMATLASAKDRIIDRAARLFGSLSGSAANQ